MARRKAIDISKDKPVIAQRVFTDREEPQKSFQKRLSAINDRKCSILHFYGVGGIGKTSLQEHLKKKHLENDGNAVYSWIDFENDENQKDYIAYRLLADRFSQKFKIKFTTFDIAYTIYLKKAHPKMEISKKSLPFIEEGSILASVIDQLEEVGGMASLGVGFVKYVVEKIQDMSFNVTIQHLLNELDDLEANEIEKKLIGFLAYDIKIYKENNPSKKIVIFLDTYEALWKNDRKESNILTKDSWIRDDLVTNLPNVLFIICGREKLRWEKDDISWIEIQEDGFADLEQHTIGNLSNKDIKYFLTSCQIKENNIQDAIIKSCGGVPYYLDLCVETYERIIDSNKELLENEFKNVDQHKIFERFMRYLDKEEVATLKLLSIANFYEPKLFQKTIKHFNTGYPATDFELFNSFSFIKTEKDLFYIHDLMRNSLQLALDDELRKKAHSFFFQYYNKQLEDLDPRKMMLDIDMAILVNSYKDITDESTVDAIAEKKLAVALKEAFYHKSNLNSLKDLNDLNDWFNPIYTSFASFLDFSLRQQIIEQLTDRNKKEFGEEHPNTIQSRSNLARLYQDIGSYNNAELEYQKILNILKNTWGEEHPNTAITYKNLGDIYFSTKKEIEALELFEKALKILESKINIYPSIVTEIYCCQAKIYTNLKEYSKAFNLYELALRYTERYTKNPIDIESISAEIEFLGEVSGMHATAAMILGEETEIYCDETGKLLYSLNDDMDDKKNGEIMPPPFNPFTDVEN